MKSYIVMLVIIVAMFWLMNRNTRKRQKAAAEFKARLAPGVQVMTASGYVGTVVSIDGDLATLQSVDGARTTWVLAALAKEYEATPAAPVLADTSASADPSSTTGFVVPDNVSSLITKPGENAPSAGLESFATEEEKKEKPHDEK